MNWIGQLRRDVLLVLINPLSPNSDMSQFSHCDIKGYSVREVMRTENITNQVNFS